MQLKRRSRVGFRAEVAQKPRFFFPPAHADRNGNWCRSLAVDPQHRTQARTMRLMH